MAEPERVYWDSDVCLGYLKGETIDDRATRCEHVLSRASAGELVIVVSALTLAEVVYLKGAPPIPESEEEVVHNFFMNEWIVIHTVDRPIAEAARRLVWRNGVKPKDAIHVATAVRVGAARLETFDTGLLTRSLQIGQPPLPISKPPLPPNPWETGLFQSDGEADDDEF